MRLIENGYPIKIAILVAGKAAFGGSGGIRTHGTVRYN